MQLLFNVVPRRLRAMLTLILLFSSTFASADTMTLSPMAWGSARDGGSSSFPVVDGQFDALLGGSTLFVRRTQGTSIQSEYRAAYEFVLPMNVMQSGVTINQVTLTVPVMSENLPNNDVITVHGAIGGGPLTVDSFEVSNPASQATIFTGLPTTSRSFNVPYYLQSFPGSSHTRVLFVFAASQWGTSLSWGSGATLTIDYTPPQGSPPTLTILSPSNGAAYILGDNISLQATSTDAEDGSRDWAINWTSNINGWLGAGGNVLVNQLNVGSHLISATLHDTHGNTVVQTRSITVTAVTNTPPTVTITSPATGTQLSTGITTHFLASANDTEEGSLNSSIKWWIDGTTFLGTGADLPTQVPVGWHTISARIIDSGGLIAESTISVNVVAPPPPTSYCTAKGASSSMEWIGGVAMNGGGQISASNFGYADFTATQITANKGSNTISLTPGFSSGAYNEYWTVWIDLNRDLMFAAEEQVATGSSNSTLLSSLNIPSSVANGLTRMRVAMSYGSPPSSCGTFSYGEVEDYTVKIVDGPPNPPPQASYCNSRGTTSSYEWIARTDIAGIARVSGNNGGYADFTTATAVPLAYGANSFMLTPGFSSSTYQERMSAWIDFNQDKTFSSNELVFSGGAAQAVSGMITVPTTALAGTTRMRVQMKYGSNASACETFSYGEVEDYAVQIR